MRKIKKWINNHLVDRAKKLSELDYVTSLNTAFAKNNAIFLAVGVFAILLLSFGSFSVSLKNFLTDISHLGISTYLVGLVFFISYFYAEKKLVYFEALPIAIQNIFLFLVFLLPFGKINMESYFIAIFLPLILINIVDFIEEQEMLIRLPRKVPSAVADLMNMVIPLVITVFLIVICNKLSFFVIGQYLAPIISRIFKQVTFVVDTFWFVFLIMFFTQILWVLGIHGGSVTGIITTTFYTHNMLANLESWLMSKIIPYTMTNTLSVYAVVIGGAGASLSLALMMRKSKSKHLREVSKAGLFSSLFGINEPILYATPLINNILFEIPFVLTPLVNTALSYFLTVKKIIPKTFIPLPWAFPSIIGLPISMWSFKAFILIFAIIFIDTLIYYPFFKKYEKQLLEKEGEI